MKILVTNHHLQEYTGSEVSIITLCKYLQKENNEVTVYSKYLTQEIINNFIKNNIKIIDNIELIKNEKFDIGHIQHNICAYEVREKFPKLPLVIWIHGKYPFLEQPPLIDLNISYFLRNNEEGIKDLKEKEIDCKKIILFRNLVDPEIFKPEKKINKKIKTALILSNKLPKEKEIIIRNVLKKLNIKSIFIGNRFKIIRNELLPKYINQADIVFTIGLGAMESMMCGRIPILFDYNFSDFEDGIVTPENFDKFKKCNFSGRFNKRIMNKQDLISDIKKYNYKNGEILQKKALEEYNAEKQIKKIIAIYKKTIKEFRYKKISDENQKILFHINQVIKETNYYTKSNCYLLNKEKIAFLNEENKKLQQDLNQIKQIQEKNRRIENEINLENKKIYELEKSLEKIRSAKAFKLWRLYCKITGK